MKRTNTANDIAFRLRQSVYQDRNLGGYTTATPTPDLVLQAADEVERLREGLGSIGLTWAEYTNGDWTAEEAMKRVAEAYAKATMA